MNDDKQQDPDAAMERFEEFARKVFSAPKPGTGLVETEEVEVEEAEPETAEDED
jgi:D-serine dehydratase